MEPSFVVEKLTQYVALLLALCVHEMAHAASARALGDPTAEEAGRLTLSPLAHVDLLGTVVIPLVGLFGGGWLIGWARPTPVQPANFRRGWYAKGQVLVAAMGPISNLVQALFWIAVHAVVVRLPLPSGVAADLGRLAGHFVVASVFINLILMGFNLLPVPPLDGSHVVSWTLPRPLAERYDQLVGRAGFFLLLLLIVPVVGGRSVVSLVLSPLVRAGDAALRLVA
jgi:Zn-dependent protease